MAVEKRNSNGGYAYTLYMYVYVSEYLPCVVIVGVAFQASQPSREGVIV